MLNGVNKELFRSYSKEICRSKALRYRRSSRSTRKEDYKLSKDEFQIVKVQIVKLVKHNNDKLLKLLKRYQKINRNDTVTIQNVANGQTQEMKYKKESLIASGQWVVVKSNSFSATIFLRP
jgi:preprotein translocase subunit SecA